ncbi:TetR/AcrR family transcriptional regulator C-terminal domain-containing protein [Nonomuraea wenchangensis]
MSETKRPPLSRDALIETALRLLDEVGLDGVTVRRLAGELGVQSPALYWHIRTKQELLDGIADAIILAAGMGPPGDGEAWKDWLARRARAYRRSLLAHRDGARIVATATRLGTETLKLLEQELSALVAHGLTPLSALRAITACTQYVNGFVLQEQAARPPADDLLPLLEQAPTLLKAIGEGGAAHGEETFEHGLRALINGLDT